MVAPEPPQPIVLTLRDHFIIRDMLAAEGYDYDVTDLEPAPVPS